VRCLEAVDYFLIPGSPDRACPVVVSGCGEGVWFRVGWGGEEPEEWVRGMG